MGVLSAAARKKLPAKDFAGPGRSFPVEDPGHAKAALSMVGRAEKKGSVSPMAAVAIKRKAKMKLKIKQPPMDE